MHVFCFGTIGDRQNRRRLRQFPGFTFGNDSDQFSATIDAAVQNLSSGDLISICNLLGLDYAGTPKEVATRICENLMDLQKLGQNIEENGDDMEDDGDNDPVQPVEMVAENRRSSGALSLEVSGPFSAPATSKFAMSFRDVEDTMQQFTGEGKRSIESWVTDFEENSMLFGWDPIQKLIYGKRLLSGLAKLYIQGEKGLTTWEKLKFALTNEFSVKMNSAELHDILSKRKMRREESVQEYYLVMKELASRGNVEDEALMQYVINGISGDQSSKGILYGAYTLSEFRDKLRTYNQMRDNQNRRHNTPNVTAGMPKIPERKVDDKRSIAATVKCYNCNKMGHFANECRSMKREKGSCFRCGSTEHQKRDCPRQSTTGAVPTETSSAWKTTHLVQEKLELVPNFEVELKLEPTGEIIKALVDTGSPISLLSEFAVPESAEVEPFTSVNQFEGVNKSKINILGQIKQGIEVQGCTTEICFYVVPVTTMSCVCLLGRDFIAHDKLQVTFEKCKVNIKLSDDKGPDGLVAEILNIDVCNEIDSDLNLSINPNLDWGKAKQVENLVEEYYSKGKPKCPETNFQMKINVKSGYHPFFFRPRRLSFYEKDEVNKIIDDLLKQKVIRKSNSEYSSPIVLVRKKPEGIRLCVDYRELNKITSRDNFPLPLIDDQLDRLRNKTYFTKLDLKNAFHHVNVSEESIKFTSFVTHNGQYEYLKMPFGLKNSPATFTRFINLIF